MADTPKWYDGHLKEFQQTAGIKSKEEFDEMYRRSIKDVDNFWAEAAREYLTWDKEWDSVLKWSFGDEVSIKWFDGGMINASYNCLDRHLDKINNRVAYFCEGDEPSDSHAVTYLALYKEVNKFAAVLEKQGVKKGDRVPSTCP